MLKNILHLEGVQILNQKERKLIKAGTQFGSHSQCLSLCAGRCTASGRCFWMIE